MSAVVKKHKVDLLLLVVVLESFQHTECGNHFIKYFPEDRNAWRLPLAFALAKQPLILFLDEQPGFVRNV